MRQIAANTPNEPRVLSGAPRASPRPHADDAQAAPFRSDRQPEAKSLPFVDSFWRFLSELAVFVQPMHSSTYSRNRFADMTRPFMTHLGFRLRQFGMANTSSQAFCRVAHCRVAQIGGATSAALFCLPPSGQSLARRLFGSQHVGFSLIAGGKKTRVFATNGW